MAVVLSVVLVACTAGTTDEPAPEDVTQTTKADSTTTDVQTTATRLPGADPILGVVPPEPTDYPFVKYSYRWIEYQAQCAAGAGIIYRIVDSAAPFLSYAGTDEQRRIVVSNRCEAIAQERGWAIPNPFDGSAEANALLYDIYVDIHDCMVEHGYPTTDPPSKDAFIEEGEALWTPWEEMFNSVFYVDPDEQMSPSDRLQYEAQEACGGLPNEIYDQQLQEQGQ
jgi:hypothetical protein